MPRVANFGRLGTAGCSTFEHWRCAGPARPFQALLGHRGVPQRDAFGVGLPFAPFAFRSASKRFTSSATVARSSVDWQLVRSFSWSFARGVCVGCAQSFTVLIVLGLIRVAWMYARIPCCLVIAFVCYQVYLQLVPDGDRWFRMPYLRFVQALMHPQIQAALPFVESLLLHGSYVRGTINNAPGPNDSSMDFDLDIYAICPREVLMAQSMAQLLSSKSEVLRKRGFYNVSIGRYGWKLSWRLSKLKFDVVPAFESEGRFFIYDTKAACWVGNNPVAVRDALRSAQRAWPDLMWIIDAIKWYNQYEPHLRVDENGSKQPPLKGFHIEIALYCCSHVHPEWRAVGDGHMHAYSRVILAAAKQLLHTMKRVDMYPPQADRRVNEYLLSNELNMKLAEHMLKRMISEFEVALSHGRGGEVMQSLHRSRYFGSQRRRFGLGAKSDYYSGLARGPLQKS